MFIDTKPSTTPHTAPARIRRGALKTLPRLRARRGRHGSTVVRVRFPLASKLYAYRCNGPAGVGSEVIVDSPLAGPTILTVVALGRGDYTGPLKTCELVR